MLDPSLLRGIGERFPDLDLIPSIGKGVDEGDLGAVEKRVDQDRVVEKAALEQGDPGQILQFLCDKAFGGVDLSSDLPSYGRHRADDGCCLSACAIDDGHSLRCVWHTHRFVGATPSAPAAPI